MICGRCQTRPKNPHYNAKWCKPCAAELKKRPLGKLTPIQERQVRKLAGTMYISDLAKTIGTSDSNVDRWAKQNNVNINGHKIKKYLVDEVCEYYKKNGMNETKKRYPGVKIRSIIDGYYKLPPRQIRWTAPQLIKLTQMAGIVNYEQQAKYFNRPNAHKGSIKSVWSKKFKLLKNRRSINGPDFCFARYYVDNSCPFYMTGLGKKTIAFWVDIAEHLLPDVHEHLRAAILTMAKFQKWIHGKNYRKNLMCILKGELE